MSTGRARRHNETEVEAYDFIRSQLTDSGWRVNRPRDNSNGQVWTQNQCLSDPAIQHALGQMRPENIIKVSEGHLWIIEAKAGKRQIEQALAEAKRDYAEKISADSGIYKASIASGIAGNEESGYLVRTEYRTHTGWKPVKINGKEITGFLTPPDAQRLLQTTDGEIQDFIPSQQVFLRAAEHINATLHNGGINKNERAKVMAALLLAITDDPPNLDSTLAVLIKDINTRSESVLEQNQKGEFAKFIHLIPPTSSKNHVKYKGALVRTIQELRNLNIRSAMNSDTDVLGQFYEKFLKYGNGAKEIGIVLTPRHIARFAAESLSVSATDIVYDPACGTGGFLVAAFDRVRRQFSESELNRFKRNNIFGVEQEPYIAILAIVNMIFRGDGRHHIEEGNAHTTYLRRCSRRGVATAEYVDEPPGVGETAVTRVLMNPPFALTTSKEKEFDFVNAGLAQMIEGGLLFSLLPLDNLFGTRDELTWRSQTLLAENTLRAVITFPQDLFTPAAQKQVAGIIVERGHPHPRRQPVFWARAAHDGFIVTKCKRLEAAGLTPPRVEPDDLSEILPHLKSFLADPDRYRINEPMRMTTKPIDFSDPILELMPEAYLDSAPVQESLLRENIDVMGREMASFLIRFSRERDAG